MSLGWAGSVSTRDAWVAAARVLHGTYGGRMTRPAESDPPHALTREEQAHVVRDLLEREGETFAEQAGIDLRDEPGPLWQLLVLTNLLSNRIRSEAAIASARQLWKIGCDSPGGTRGSTWQRRVDALGRGGYRRYDFSTSTRLGKNAEFVRTRWDDDLRRLRDDADGDPRRIEKLLQEFDGIGPAGARIFLRETQGLWPSVAPAVDPKVLDGARSVGLPADAEMLAELVSPDELPRLCAALVRAAKRPGRSAT